MNLKKRFSFFFSFMMMMLLSIVLLVVYTLFSRFRHEEFIDRLEEKAINTVLLLLKVKEVDEQLLKIIDKNTIQRLYNEKVLVFDQHFRLIYSSIDDAPLYWSTEELRVLKKTGTAIKQNGMYEMFGKYFDFDEEDYYAVVSAEDVYGNRKLTFLRYLLVGSFLITVGLVWLVSYYLSKRALQPLDTMRERIAEISGKNLSTRLEEYGNDDEIGSITRSFNDMLFRIEEAYIRQKRFTANASHELRTPVTRLVAQLENQIRITDEGHSKNVLQQVLEEAYQLSDIITSLLLLSSLEDRLPTKEFPLIRLDEVIFRVVEKIRLHYPDFRFEFEMESSGDAEGIPELPADDNLLGIALSNLFLNGYKYSENRSVYCRMICQKNQVQIILINSGKTPIPEELDNVFNAFARGSNTKGISGSGMGLSIVKRILDSHGATILYTVPATDLNQIALTFYLQD